MLRIHIGDMDGQIEHISSYFNVVFEREWFDDPMVRAMIKDIDKSDVICGSAIDSPVLGPISPRELSGGVKMLICMLKEPDNADKVYYGTSCGDNCGKWMIEIGKLKDITISITYLLKFRSPEDKNLPGMNAICLNDGKPINTMMDFVDAYYEHKKVVAYKDNDED